MSDCIFCQVISGTLPSKPVFRDGDVIVIPDISPQAPVHLLVIPKKHVAEFIDADSGLLAKMAATVQKMITDQHIVNYRIVSNGKGAAVIDHLHIHILGNVDKFRKL
ncbi:HIT domain-containing protein [Candidatus Gottesmanbacteria bacterium]|nr:HIT domain-containing protein [Candidatus Gottesmanbacteria bacterium]